MEEPIYTPPGGPPQGPRPDPSIYDAMGIKGIFKMCEDFYQLLGASEIKDLFPEDLIEASRRQAAFLVGILGGPPLYQQLYGPPRMRARHLPFAIDEKARQIWLGCFNTVLKTAPSKYQLPEEHLPGFQAWLDEFSAWMVNRNP